MTECERIPEYTSQRPAVTRAIAGVLNLGKEARER
jgi:hypothetical protein